MASMATSMPTTSNVDESRSSEDRTFPFLDKLKEALAGVSLPTMKPLTLPTLKPPCDDKKDAKNPLNPLIPGIPFFG